VNEYDEEFPVSVSHSFCRIQVRMALEEGNLEAFVVQLEAIHTSVDDWDVIAQIDHEPGAPGGHDLFVEGIHVDVFRFVGEGEKLWPDHPQLFGVSDGALLRACIDYLGGHADWFFQTATGLADPVDPPQFDW